MDLIRNFFRRRRIKKLFGTYVSPALVERIVNAGEMPRLGGEEREITAFFGSIHSYVALAEQIPLAQLPALMNAYFTASADAIQAENGTLDKYVGDTVVAMFGTPLPLPNHALHACVAALKIQDQIADLREKFQGEAGKWPKAVHELRVRIGLNSGKAMVGNLGSSTRFNYTMMGDEVNLAARLEATAKAYGVWTLCTGSTQSACDRADPGRVFFRSLGPMMVKGRANPVELFEPVALREEATDTLRECVGLFERGLGLYLTKDWDGAETFFRRSAMLEANQPGKTPTVERNPSLTFIAQCDYMRTHPPGTEWQGAYLRTS